ncbi:transposase [Ligilactobacillus saerimneri]|uniref:RNA-guided endonuclease InsQ/TnpB family protein n=1 Tax=Ligilactobacillus saerimneri TaxID=228229 RepID=UPI0030CA5EA1
MPKKSSLPYMMGLKLRMFPNHKQEIILWKNINASRFIYNQLLANSYVDSAIRRNKLDEKYPIPAEYWRYNKQGNPIKKSQNRPVGLDRITADRYPWLGDADLDSDMFNNTQVHYQHAWNMFRKVHPTGGPKFKRKDRPVQSYSTSNRYAPSVLKKKGELPSLYNGTSVRFIDRKHIRLPKVGTIKVKLHRSLPTNRLVRIATVTIKHLSSGEWFVSLLLKSDEPFQISLPKTGKVVGIDLNTDNFLTQSDAEVVENPRYYRTIKKRLAKYQRILSRRARRAKKEHRSLRKSHNYQKQRQLVAQLHRKVRNQRQNFLHVTSTALIKNHDLVVAENLKGKNMLKSHALAMSISDVGWRMFLGMLEYKAPLYGRTFVEVNPAYTTQTCYDCGFVMGSQGTQRLTLRDRQWNCPKCYAHHVRDHNAAQNILAKGQLLLAKPAENKATIYQ